MLNLASFLKKDHTLVTDFTVHTYKSHKNNFIVTLRLRYHFERKGGK